MSRDDHCWHCGTQNDLVPHHRINRGMGSSKLLDVPENIIMVCAQYNGQMESSAQIAELARSDGHKLSRWQSLREPVFDCFGRWWYLHSDGHKTESWETDQPF